MAASLVKNSGVLVKKPPASAVGIETDLELAEKGEEFCLGKPTYRVVIAFVDSWENVALWEAIVVYFLNLGREEIRQTKLYEFRKSILKETGSKVTIFEESVLV